MNWNLGYNLYNTYTILHDASDVDNTEFDAEIKTNKYQIYLIGKRKKFFFDRCDQGEEQNTSVFYYLDDNRDKQYIHRLHETTIILKKSNILGNVIYEDNGVATEYRAFDLLSRFFHYRLHNQDNSMEGNHLKAIWPSDIEIMYVGQSFGNLRNRISKHEKIKNIALRIIRESSNEDVFLFCTAIKANDNVTGFITQDTEVDVSTASLKKLQKKAGKRVSMQQQVTLYEASLIKYFQPEFNTEYKDTFPGLGYTSYNQIYATDFNYISAAFVVPDDEIPVRVWSQHIDEPAFAHSVYFPLKTVAEKKSLFDFLYDESTAV
jgi:hypothetical protein